MSQQVKEHAFLGKGKEKENPNLLTVATYRRTSSQNRRRLPPPTPILSPSSSSPSLKPVVSVALHFRRLHVLRDTDPPPKPKILEL
ncbi:hypothetical protein PIB30_021644 [Stylosanthes scabra]|uniref:Uncharacterized protein n=1 Tax=Stylosanthes scabra TaxID=79078 RepID=A0ABU6X6B9_9FABA|nr:hypothetical protein [Stylosanthes scabra]